MKKYIIEKVVLENNGQMWDVNNSDDVVIPNEIINFMREYEDLCKKYNISLGHEDGHGAFEFHEYKNDNIEWVAFGMLNK